MPISEEVYYFGSIKEREIMMSKAELRKTHKPIMEKRRRARINHCLNEIKSLILEAMNKDPARHSKLEKADILEMAVKHLQNVQRQQLALAMATDSAVLRKFKNGFNECTNEIDKYIEEMDITDSGLKERMTSHLHKCITGIDQVAHMSNPGFSNLAFMSSSISAPSSSTTSEQPPDDQNNNNNSGRSSMQIPQSIQLIPSRLSSGEIALLVPNSSNLPFLPINEQRNRPSAFVTVVPSSSAIKEESTPPSPQKSYSSSSPQGFRPIQLTKFTSSSYEEHQVPQVSSTSVIINDIKPLKYPIHVYPGKDKKVLSPKKTVEPLCIITNHQERYKQAQSREDSVAFDENRFQNVNTFHPQGLLVTVPSGQECRPTSVIKTAGVDLVLPHAVETPISQQQQKIQGEGASCSKSNVEANSDMWRPW